MASIDDRIVRMEFDNAAFERKIQTTLSSISQLDKALKLTGATKGLTDVSDAAAKINMGTISTGIENVSKGFITLSTIAITAISGITSRIIDMGLQLGKSLSLDQVAGGFSEYELKLGSIQTIMAGSGASLEEVNAKLQTLNEYSDKTIYSFRDMTTNIGKFTNAGLSLDASVAAIQGVANVAAVSGANAEEAGRAMYNFAQALSKGHVALIDWKSIELANMGTVEFKQQLIDAGEAMGTLTKEGDHWMTSAGNAVTATKGFNESLTDEWLTTEALTSTLGKYSDATTDIGAKATAAATQVKTFTQLLGTVKESVGSGFAQSFEIIIGDFNEAKTLWTDVNTAISNFVGKSAAARNAILQGWKDFGGRTALIDAFKSAFHTLGEVLNTVKEAFHEIFPPVTAATLLRLTDGFRNLVTEMIPSIETIGKIKAIFTGFFAALSIGWEIIKQGTKFIRDIAMSLLGLITPGASDFLVKLSGGLVKLQEALVKGGGIKDFFTGLTTILQKPIALLGKFKDALANVFDIFSSGAADAAGASVDRLGDRFENLKNLMSKLGDIWKPLENALMKVVEILDSVWQVLKDWFSQLGDKLAESMGDAKFNNVLDAINTGLLGGIALLIARFLKNGFTFDLGGGLFDKMSKSLEQLTGVFKAMQANIKANVLLKIAGAIAILTASVVVLSMIDSVALTRALTAMAVGFGQLIGAFTLLNNLDVKSVAKMSVIAASLIMLGAAMLILSVAVKILSSLSWDEMLRGLVGITGLLLILSGAAKLLSKNSENMISAGVGIAAISAGLVVLAVAMKIFATMSWEEMGKGLVGVAGGLGLLVAAVKLMPDDKEMIRLGISLILISVGLGLMAVTMKVFATMPWDEMGKGFVGVAAGLGLMVAAMRLMPEDMGAKAAGLLIASAALVVIGVAIKMLSKLSWEELAKGLVGIGGAMLILVIAAQKMESAIPGAGAMVVVAAAMLVLAVAMKIMGSMSWGDIAKGLTIIAVAILGFAAAAAGLSEVLPAMLGLGVALVLLGAGIALLGVGLFLLGKGLESIAAAGPKAAAALDDILISVGKSLPALLTGLAQGIVEMVQVFSDAAPIFAKAIAALIVSLLDELSKIIPKLGAVIRLLVEEIFKIIRSYGAEYIKTGLFILTTLLEGLRDNIGPITTMVGDIIVNFLKAFQEQVPRVAQELADTIILMFTTAAYEIGLVAGTLLVGIGKSFITGLIDGVDSQTGGLMSKIIAIPGDVVTWIGDVATKLWQKGVDFITGLIGGLNNIIGQVQSFIQGIPGNVIIWIGDTLGTLVGKGQQILEGLKNGIDAGWSMVTGWFSGFGGKIQGLIPDPLGILLDIGKKIMHGLKNGIDAGFGMVEDALGKVTDMIPFKKGPPKKDAMLLYNNGVLIMQGLRDGMQHEWKNTEKYLENVDPSEHMNKNLGNNMAKVLGGVTDKMSDMDEMNPVITPVLDLTRVERDAKKIHGHIHDKRRLSIDTSRNSAKSIAKSHNARNDEPTSDPVAPPASINFEQVINAPTQLSTSDIYKATRNQIRIAKEELRIP